MYTCTSSSVDFRIPSSALVDIINKTVFHHGRLLFSSRSSARVISPAVCYYIHTCIYYNMYTIIYTDPLFSPVIPPPPSLILYNIVSRRRRLRRCRCRCRYTILSISNVDALFLCFFFSEIVYTRRRIDKRIVPLRVYKYVHVIRPALLFRIIFLTLNRVTIIIKRL